MVEVIIIDQQKLLLNHLQVNMNLTARSLKRKYIQKTLTIGGKTHYFKSSYEIQYAYWLEALRLKGKIKDWFYEVDTFWFDGIKRGTNNYKPDFKIIDLQGGLNYVEVKGYMDSKSATKIKRMGKYHPDIRLTVLEADWFKRNREQLDIVTRLFLNG